MMRKRSLAVNQGGTRSRVRLASHFRLIEVVSAPLDEPALIPHNPSMARRVALTALAVTGLVGLVLSALLVARFDDASTAGRWLVMGPFPFWLAGAFLAWRRPDHGISPLLLAVGTLFADQTCVEYLLKTGSATEGSSWLLVTAYMFSMIILLVVTSRLVGLFPDGRPRFRGERRLLRSLWWLAATPVAVLLSSPTLRLDQVVFDATGKIDVPVAFAGLAPLSEGTVVVYQLALLAPIVGIVLLVRRYRSLPVEERLQTRWVLYSMVVALILGIGPFLLSSIGLSPGLHDTPLLSDIGYVPVMLLPASIVISVMRARAFDIDRLARKSLVFAALWFLILLIYLAIAAAGGLALGERVPLEIAVLVTALVAIVLQPARRRLEEMAGRWVFGERPTDYEVVAEFGASLREGGEPAEFVARLVTSVVRALDLSWCRVRMDDGSMISAGTVTGLAVHTVPIASSGETFGMLECGPRVEGSINAHDREVLTTLVDHAALAVRSTRLASRIVHAQEAERRRIERNIHDGAQQELVALVAGLGLARSNAEHGRVEAEDLEGLQREAGRILVSLRELAQGIHPSVLTDGGLVEAIEERCGRVPLEVAVTTTPGLRGRRFADDIEGAAYFFVCEGLANVLKHANASRVEIGMALKDKLHIQIEDNGVGIGTHRTGSGLAGLHDRISALGGSMQVLGRAGGGTHLSASLPVGGTS
jgi:signal transduction histidine kinase